MHIGMDGSVAVVFQDFMGLMDHNLEDDIRIKYDQESVAEYRREKKHYTNYRLHPHYTPTNFEAI